MRCCLANQAFPFLTQMGRKSMPGASRLVKRVIIVFTIVASGLATLLILGWCATSRYHLLRGASAHRSRLGMHYVPIPVARPLSEMPNYVAAEEPQASSGAIVERRDIGRPVVADLGADLDLRADPMLPAGRDVDVARGIARALALHVIVKLGAQREIVERADAIVPEGEQAVFVGRAGWQYGVADRLARRGHHAVPGRAVIGIDRIVEVAGALVSFVPHVALIHVIAFERDVKLLVELVIVRAAVPVHVVVAPSGVVQVVDTEIGCVVA